MILPVEVLHSIVELAYATATFPETLLNVLGKIRLGGLAPILESQAIHDIASTSNAGQSVSILAGSGYTTTDIMQSAGFLYRLAETCPVPKTPEAANDAYYACLKAKLPLRDVSFVQNRFSAMVR